jgi:hypothetical protein
MPARHVDRWLHRYREDMWIGGYSATSALLTNPRHYYSTEVTRQDDTPLLTKSLRSSMTGHDAPCVFAVII